MKSTNMSRIGKQPIIIPQGVECTINDGAVAVKGPKGLITIPVPEAVTVSFDAEKKQLTVTVANPNQGKERALWGLIRQLVQR